MSFRQLSVDLAASGQTQQVPVRRLSKRAEARTAA